MARTAINTTWSSLSKGIILTTQDSRSREIYIPWSLVKKLQKEEEEASIDDKLRRTKNRPQSSTLHKEEGT